MKPIKTIDEILMNFADEWHFNVMGLPEKTPAQLFLKTKQDILKLIMENMPTLPITELTEWRKGYNQFQYIQSIKKLFE